MLCCTRPYHIIFSRITLILSISLLVLAGCVNANDRKEIKLKTLECPDISGTYNNIGEFIETDTSLDPGPPVGTGDPYVLHTYESDSPQYPDVSCAIENNKISSHCVLSAVLQLDPVMWGPNVAAADYVGTDVEIDILDDDIRLRLYKNKSLLRELYLGKEKLTYRYRCNNDTFIISEGHRGGYYTGYRATKLSHSFKRGSDDDLVLEVDYLQYGLLGRTHMKANFRWKKVE